MEIALAAAGCMVIQDVLATVMVQAEASNHGWLAGLMDMLGWYFSIATTAISVNAINSHSLSTKIWVLTLVGLANILGTKLGQITGKHVLGSLNFRTKMTIRAVSRK